MNGDTDEDDPMDDSTHWIGNLPEQSVDCTERVAQRSSRWSQQPDIQRKELPVAERRKA